ncbi:hypothetical protein AB7M33_003926 [Pseudomonas sp. Y3 TE3536]|jgi:hypothetical protein
MQDEPKNESPSLDHLEHVEEVVTQKTVSWRTRGAAPVVGMPCAPGYKRVGDECVLANIPFE